MPYSPLLPVHVAAGITGIVSGAAALSFRKGGVRHGLAGRVFVAAMLIMASAAVYLAVLKNQPNNIGGGILAFYLILSAWLTVRGRAAAMPGVPVGMNFFMSSVMLLAAAGDLRMLAGGGVAGTRRIVRHLWRMCFGLFIATGSFFLGQQQVFPNRLRGSALLFVPALLPLVLLIFWLLRVWLSDSYRRKLGVPEQRTI